MNPLILVAAIITSYCAWTDWTRHKIEHLPVSALWLTVSLLGNVGALAFCFAGSYFLNSLADRIYKPIAGWGDVLLIPTTYAVTPPWTWVWLTLWICLFAVTYEVVKKNGAPLAVPCALGLVALLTIL